MMIGCIECKTLFESENLISKLCPIHKDRYKIKQYNITKNEEENIFRKIRYRRLQPKECISSWIL